MCTVNAALAAIRIVISNGFMKFTIHSLDVTEGNHDRAPLIIYQKAPMDLNIASLCAFVISLVAGNVRVVAFALTLFCQLA